MSRANKGKHGFNNPFSPLKGLSVSGAENPPAPVPSAPPDPPAEPEDPALFAREMAWLNVRPVAGRAASQAGDERTLPPPAASMERDGSDEFLAAVGQLDTVFTDELPAEDEPSRARPRRMKQLERGVLKPCGELDLHGLTRDEAVARTRAYLGHAARQGWPVIVIVTGKGLHSSEGPVLRRAVEHLLGESRDLVLEWGEAPRRLGGAGALAVFVRRGRERQT